MPMAKITPVGEAGLYHVHFLDARDPGFGGGRPGGVDPGWGAGHPGLHPDQGLPGGGWPGHPDQGLPGGGGRPSHPIAPGHPGHPDQGLPPTVPTLLPGWTLAAVRTHDGKWHYASVPPNTAPPKPLPEPIPPGGAPDQGLPPQTGAPTPAPTAR